VNFIEFIIAIFTKTPYNMTRKGENTDDSVRRLRICLSRDGVSHVFPQRNLLGDGSQPGRKERGRADNGFPDDVSPVWYCVLGSRGHPFPVSSPDERVKLTKKSGEIQRILILDRHTGMPYDENVE
jgi:hypothetical protein